MEFKRQQVLPGFAESCSKMYILPTLTYLEVGGPAVASEIFIFEPFNYEPIFLLNMLPAQHARPSVAW